MPATKKDNQFLRLTLVSAVALSMAMGCASTPNSGVQPDGSFRETFEEISKRFSENFPRMFGGGKGSLMLTDHEDVLEAGIDIMAQPPGKRLQNVNLLSGGEKTMTAIALLVAVFQVRPSPFFLLDEVDAALDDANVGRFNQLVTELAVTSQFLIITHNKRTIEVADVLYGVTMEQKGVSKLVAVELH